MSRRRRLRRQWRKLVSYRRGSPHRRPEPNEREDFLTIYVPMADALRQGNLTLEQRARAIEFAQTAASIAVSQTIREQFPIKWDAPRLARIAQRKAVGL